jgi:hypothetical protein
VEIANRQAQTAAQQAETAAKQVQIAERQAVTTAFQNAVSRLASDEIEERLGGIYVLESISRDSQEDYWPVIETLTAFVRERMKRQDRATVAPPAASGPRSVHIILATDIAAVLTVLRRRPDAGRAREKEQGWIPDLRGIDLRDTDLQSTVLAGMNLAGAHLEGANLFWAHLEDANLTGAHLEGADLTGAHLGGVSLFGAHLEGAKLRDAYLTGAILLEAHLEGAVLLEAHLEGVDLRGTYGDARTLLSDGVTRPARWSAS